MTKTLTLYLCGCTPVEELLSNPFDLDSHCDLSKVETEAHCEECGDCKLEPKKIELTLTAKEK